MGSNQGHTQVSPVGTVVVSTEEEPISVSVMYGKEKMYADDINKGTIWELNESASENVTDDASRVLVVKPEVGQLELNSIDRMEMQIYNPKDADNSVPLAIIEKEYVATSNYNVVAHAFSELRHVFTNTSGTKVKTVIKFREDGSLIIKYFHKTPNKNWAEDCRLVYTSDGTNFEDSDHASDHSGFEPVGRMLGDYKPQNIYSLAPPANYFRKVRKGTYDKSNGVKLKMRDYDFEDVFFVATSPGN